MVDEKTKALIEARLKAEQEAEAEDRRRAAAPMTDRQIAQLKMEVRGQCVKSVGRLWQGGGDRCGHDRQADVASEQGGEGEVWGY